MRTHPKISPAFEPFMAESGPNDKRDAIVIHRTERLEAVRVRGRLRKLKERLDDVKARAAAQKHVQAQLFEAYQEIGGKHLRGGGHLRTSEIGESILPVGTVEVTKKTLPDLAAQPDVVAILPNQRIQLIEPKTVDYADLGKQEVKDGLTWGLKQLDIPKLWETTKGEDINVAVLDTGVYGDHPALAGRVRDEDFIVIDPLGLALENFDVTGAWRVKDNGAVIDPSGELYDGTPIADPPGLRRALLNRSGTMRIPIGR